MIVRASVAANIGRLVDVISHASPARFLDPDGRLHVGGVGCWLVRSAGGAFSVRYEDGRAGAHRYACIHDSCLRPIRDDEPGVTASDLEVRPQVRSAPAPTLLSAEVSEPKVCR